MHVEEVSVHSQRATALAAGGGVPCMPGDTGRPVGVLLSGLEKGKGPTYAPVCGLPVT